MSSLSLGELVCLLRTADDAERVQSRCRDALASLITGFLEDETTVRDAPGSGVMSRCCT